MKKIKILEDTPFDEKGVIIPVSEFRMKYRYLSLQTITDDELIKWLINERTAYLEEMLGKLKNRDDWYPKDRIGYWFEIVKQRERFFFGGREIFVVKSEQPSMELFLYEPLSRQYFSVDDIYEWFFHYKRFLHGFSAYKNHGSCDDACLSRIMFLEKGNERAFGIDFIPEEFDKIKTNNVWKYVKEHIELSSIKDQELTIKINIGDVVGDINELYEILEYIDSLEDTNDIPIHKL